jgi:hypothetical protein
MTNERIIQRKNGRGKKKTKEKDDWANVWRRYYH